MNTGNYFQGYGEQAHSFGDLGSPAKKFKKNLTLKEKPSLRLIFSKKKKIGFWGLLPLASKTPLVKCECTYFVPKCASGLILEQNMAQNLGC